MADSPIGLIGIGLLGAALAERMLTARLSVLGYDCDASAANRLSAFGGQFTDSVGDVAARCHEIVLCLPDSHVVAAVVNDLGGRLTSGKLIIDATTADPDATTALASQLAARGIGYIDATIAGSSEQVRRGEAVVIIGGEAGDVQRAGNVLKTWSDHRFHVGPAGSGARLKLIVNLVLGLNRAVLAEGLSLAKRCGIDAQAALDVLKATPAYSKIMDSKGPKMIASDYSPQARIAQHLKDVRLIRDLAHRHAAKTPLSDVHEALLQSAVDLGYAEADNSAIIEAFRESN
jgi:3-hydroxyisobutyrate dehydrogenase-like beta-hydroxyacid dehydrogenase